MSNAHCSIKVFADERGNEVFFKVKKSTSIRKMHEALCARQAWNPSMIALTCYGEILDLNKPCSVIPKDVDLHVINYTHIF